MVARTSVDASICSEIPVIVQRIGSPMVLTRLIVAGIAVVFSRFMVTVASAVSPSTMRSASTKPETWMPPAKSLPTSV